MERKAAKRKEAELRRKDEEEQEEARRVLEEEKRMKAYRGTKYQFLRRFILNGWKIVLSR